MSYGFSTGKIPLSTGDAERIRGAYINSEKVGLFGTCMVFQREGIYARYYDEGRP
jgi:hypothetical protein